MRFMGSPDRPTLAYASPALAGWDRWRIFRIGQLVFIAVLLATIFLGMYGPGLLKSASHWRAERACRSYAAPSDQVVYEEEPVAAAALLSKGDGYIAAPALASRSAPATVFVPRCWREFTFSASNKPQALLFLHELRSKSAARLVSVELPSDPPSL